LIASQSAIGWGQLLYGRFSKHWNLVQYNYLRARGRKIDVTSHGPAWLMKFVHTIWHHVQEEWDSRNKSRHGDTAEEQSAKRLERLKRRIEQLYTMKDQCLPEDARRIFYSSASEHFKKQSSYALLNAWYTTHSKLVHVSCQTRNEHLRLGQRVITDYFAVGNRQRMDGRDPSGLRSPSQACIR
jgi:hypothetical protein